MSEMSVMSDSVSSSKFLSDVFVCMLAISLESKSRKDLSRVCLSKDASSIGFSSWESQSSFRRQFSFRSDFLSNFFVSSDIGDVSGKEEEEEPSGICNARQFSGVCFAFFAAAFGGFL